jgi:hypothetical protein
MKAIAKKAETRFQTARAMADALTHWYDNRNTPLAPQRVHTGAMPAYRASGRSSSDVIQVVGAPPRKSHNPRLGPGAQELGRVENGHGLADEPHVLAHLDNSLSSDDPAYVDHDEATIMVPTVLPDDAIREEIPELDADFDDVPPPRASRPSVTGTPEIAALMESPLDAPPLVLPERRKPPPSDDAWARLRTDHPSAPPVDPLLDDAVVQPQPRLWPYVLLFVLVVCAGAAVAVQRFAPHSWERFKALAGLVRLPLPQRGPSSVRLVEPDAGHARPTVDAHIVPVAVVDAAPPTVADPIVDAAPVETDASIANDEAPDAATAAGFAARAARRRRRHQE